jgi:phage terminase large subunit-like protein
MKDKLFPDNLINECLDGNEQFIDSPGNMRQYFMGVDFAMSAQSGSDFTVVTVLEKAPGDKRLRIAAMERFRGMDYGQQKARIKDLADRFQVIKVLGDENSFGKVFIYDLKADGVPIEGYKFTYQSHSKEEIIKALRDQFEKQGFIIPYSRNDTKTYTMVNVLIDELTKFGIIFDMRSKTVKFEGTGKHDDCVISLALANFIARHISMGVFSAVKGSTKAKNPFVVAKS